MTKPLSSDEIRATFLDFFREKGHEVVPSSGVVPRNDPTLLFTNAGMVQFKDVFLGEDRRPYKRAASSQKCVRMSGKHNDLDNVGHTARHHTFFEMLGNFSFGDYFKRDAIAFAWELLTKVYGIPSERLVVTVFQGEKGVPADDEARALWKEATGFGDERIIGMGAKDNFWSMGDTGPCGPCTEIHYWTGPLPADLSRFDKEPGADGVGWMEIWNLVFMQFNRAEDGTLAPLPAPCVDTGAGLERVTAVLQGKMTNYDTDLLRPLVERAAEIGGRPYRGTDEPYDVACRVIADHARMAAFSLAEGVTPSNKERGAALRSVMRRAVRFAYLQGVKEPTFHRVVELAIERMGGAYPELVQHRDFIVEQARQEDARFRETIPNGLKVLEDFSGWATTLGGGRVLPGAVAWDLNATYGFPLDLTEVIGRERGFAVDERGYHLARLYHSIVSGSDEALDELRDMIQQGKVVLDEVPARVRELLGAEGGGVNGPVGDAKVRREHREALARAGGSVEFTGYDGETGESEVVAILKGPYGSKGEWPFVDALAEGEEGQVVVRSTPFYGESGGQVGDRGTITTPSGTFEVTDAQKPVGNLVVHVGRVTKGALRAGERAALEVDRAARGATRRNHSATHLLHWALRKVLGGHAQQKGSKVAPDALRFDYAASRPLTDEEIARIEDLVNREVLENRDVRTDVTTQAEARKKGAMMIFEEKYGDSVRMLHIGSESVELCGGTHVSRTGDIGLFKVVSDSNVGAGVRRIEAVTGLGALALVRSINGNLRRVAESLGAPVTDVPQRVEKALEQQRALQREVEELKRRLLTGGGGAEEAHPLADGAKLVVARAPVNEEKAMREYADHLRDKHGRAVVVIGATTADGKAVLVCAVSKDLAGRYHAGKIVGQLAQVVGGRGGGRADMAGAGGPDGSKLDEALGQARTVVA